MLESFGKTITALGHTNPNLYIVSADLASSLRLLDFKKTFPSRFIEVGVAEANMAGVAAGLAASGKTVFITSFAAFSPAINWNTIRQSICYNNLNVKIVGSHAGLAATDLGATHQMTEDIALTSTLPNMQVFAPVDGIELEKMLQVLATTKTPAYIRLVRGETPDIFPKKMSFTIGKSHILQKGSKLTVLGYGPILELTQSLVTKNPMWEDYLEVINVSSIKPLDTSTILSSVAKTGRVIVLEDHQCIGGLGQILSALFLENNSHPSFIHLGINNRFGQSGRSRFELWDEYGIGQKDLEQAVKKLLRS